jgi:xanthine/CO dehydrogenase XdhC/CoxF family maturation factor
MKELRAIVEAFEQARSDGKACALATVVGVKGSAYRRPGALMLVTEDGQTIGAVSGGCLERDVILRARRVIERGEPTLATYDTTDDDDIEFGVGLGCRGVIRILIEPLPSASQRVPTRSVGDHLALLVEMLVRREPGVLATVWRVEGQVAASVGSRLLLSSSGRLWDDIGDPELTAGIEADAQEVLQGGRSRSLVYRLAAGGAEVFLEVLSPPVPLVVFGGGRDVVPLVRLARELGWRVTVVDGRPVVASRARFPWADEVLLGRPEQVRQQVRLDGDTVAVVMTHNYLTDLRLLESLLPSPVRYLGLLGPKSRAERLVDELEQAGLRLTAAQRRRLYAPVGLDLGAETSEEIALAILAEIRAVLAGRAGGLLRDRQSPIHGRAQPEDTRSYEMSTLDRAGQLRRRPAGDPGPSGRDRRRPFLGGRFRH